MKEILSFQEDWRFHQGELEVPERKQKNPMHMEVKAQRRNGGPAAPAYGDGSAYSTAQGLETQAEWTAVTLPHDYIIAQEPQEDASRALGYFQYENAWYRKHFDLPAEDEGRRISLYFEGVSVLCAVYVNGCRLHVNRCGYTSFEVDITSAAIFGGHNVVAVHVDATSVHEGWWYEGAGIYRPVWLIKSEPVAVDLYGVFVHPEKMTDSLWALPVETTLRNDEYEACTAHVRSEARDAQGNNVCVMEADLSVPGRQKATLVQRGEVADPMLWDIDAPTLYTLETTVTVDGEIVEKQENRFGFRFFRFDSDTGLWFNGRHVKIQGVCCHQDYGLTGKAIPERVQRYRLELLKEMGANGYRCAHYPHPAYTMDQLDELGFLVMAETRHFEDTPEGMAALEMLVKRDRNHPSVILWSAGNEEPLHTEARGQRILRAMMHRIRELDPTRPVTTAVNQMPPSAPVNDVVDVMGINYCMNEVDAFRRNYPHLPMLACEFAATSTTRGWYGDSSPERGYLCCYDHDTPSFYNPSHIFWSREKEWQFIMARPWHAGGYQWAGIEHRGETIWPRLCSQAGAIDLYLNRKDAFYQNQAYWTTAPMVHLLPHWNWHGKEGQSIRVSCYTNCDHVELYLNGECIGAQDVAPFSHAEWQVPFAPGKLEAKGYREGQLEAVDVQETTGVPVRLRLKLESDGVKADGRDVAILTCDCVDAEDRHVPDAAPLVHLEVKTNGSILGTGSDVADHVPVTSPDRQMRAGLISVVARAGTQPGAMVVTAGAEGLEAAELTVMLH